STAEEVAVIETKYGRVVLEFFPDKAPAHVENFKKLAREGFYDGTAFHRVIPGFIIQGGDPNSKDDDRSNDGIGGPGYTLPQELNDISHVRGVLSMARAEADSGSQFFIMVGDAPHLDADFSAFGRVIEGMNVVDQIANVDTDEKDNPLERIEVKISITTRDKL
ncbi:MAG: peptidylprolyl isomerase, partial [Candidatus Bathyarchaeia archaeon]